MHFSRICPPTLIPRRRHATSARLATSGLLLACCALGGLEARAAAPSQAEMPIIGYWATWAGGIADIQYNYLTHVLYSFGHTNGNGTITGVNDGQIRDMVTRGHAAGIKVGVAMGGWGAHNEFIAMVATQASMDAFIASAVALCDKYGLDGIDMDWEYPTAATASAFDALMKKLSVALHAKGKFLSTCTVGDVADIGVSILQGVFASADFVNIMAYDNGKEPNHSSYTHAEDCLRYWVNQRGCPREKAILGVPFYGKMPETNYYDIIAQDRTAAQRDNLGSIYYNGIPTIKKKVQLAHQKAAGLLIWQVAGDTHDETSLLKAMYDQKKVLGPMTSLSGFASRDPQFSISSDRIRLDVTETGTYMLTLRSWSGRKLSENTFRVSTRGRSDFSWDYVGLASGAYTATLRGGRINVSRPMVITQP